MTAAKRTILLSVGLWVAAMVTLAIVLAPLMFPAGDVVGKVDLRRATEVVSVQANAGDVISTRTTFEADIDGDFLESILMGCTLRVYARGPESLASTCEVYTGSAYSSSISESHGEVTGIPNDCKIRIAKPGTYQISADDPLADHLIQERDGSQKPLVLRRSELEVRIEHAKRTR